MAYKTNGEITISDDLILGGSDTADINFSVTELLHTIDNPNLDQSANTNDHFGYSVAIDGNRAIVGVREEHFPYEDSGAAFILDVDTGVVLHSLSNPNADQSTNVDDFFGYSVAISGNRAIVGAYFEDVSFSNSGSAYIFDVDTGALLHTINNPSPFSSDAFGISVAISGNRAIVGASGVDSPYANSGAAYIFDVNTGNLLHEIDNPNSDQTTNSSDNFGNSVAISGNRAIVGAPTEDAPYSASGSIYIFDVGSGSLLHTIDNPNADQSTNTEDRFGNSVAISGNRAIVGAFGEDVPYGADGTIGSGSAYIFDVNTGTLLHTINDPNADQSTNTGDFFGGAVAISGNRAIVGAYGENISGSGSGSAYVFDVESAALLYRIDNPNSFNTSLFDGFGISVGISGNRAIAGAWAEDAPYSNSGSAYIFAIENEFDEIVIEEVEFSNGISFNFLSDGLFQVAHNSTELLYTIDNPNVDTTNSGDNFGFRRSVAISGNRIIAGAWGEDESGDFDSGVAYIFDANTGSLIHTINNPNAYNTRDFDRFGHTVAIDGNRAIVGAYLEDDALGNSSGKAYIINVDTGAVLHTLNNPSSTTTDDNFGFSVGISGNRAIVGAYIDSDVALESGKAYIFDVDTGSLLHTLDNPNPNGFAAGDRFGWSVTISGSKAVVSAYLEAVGGGQSGIAYVYDTESGQLLHTLNAPESAGKFGWDLSASKNKVLVGAPEETGQTGGSFSGSAYIFDMTSGELLQTFNNPNAYGTTLADDYFGWSLALYENRAIVGTPNEDAAQPLSNTGLVYVFDVDTGSLIHTIHNPSPQTPGGPNFDLFADSLSMFGNRAVVGARGDSDSGIEGTLFVFTVDSETYLEKIFQKEGLV